MDFDKPLESGTSLKEHFHLAKIFFGVMLFISFGSIYRDLSIIMNLPEMDSYIIERRCPSSRRAPPRLKLKSNQDFQIPTRLMYASKKGMKISYKPTSLWIKLDNKQIRLIRIFPFFSFILALYGIFMLLRRTDSDVSIIQFMFKEEFFGINPGILIFIIFLIFSVLGF